MGLILRSGFGSTFAMDETKWVVADNSQIGADEESTQAWLFLIASSRFSKVSDLSFFLDKGEGDKEETNKSETDCSGCCWFCNSILWHYSEWTHLRWFVGEGVGRCFKWAQAECLPKQKGLSPNLFKPTESCTKKLLTSTYPLSLFWYAFSLNHGFRYSWKHSE